jgi:hypothetical protein
MHTDKIDNYIKEALVSCHKMQAQVFAVTVGFSAGLLAHAVLQPNELLLRARGLQDSVSGMLAGVSDAVKKACKKRKRRCRDDPNSSCAFCCSRPCAECREDSSGYDVTADRSILDHDTWDPSGHLRDRFEELVQNDAWGTAIQFATEWKQAPLDLDVTVADQAASTSMKLVHAHWSTIEDPDAARAFAQLWTSKKCAQKKRDQADEESDEVLLWHVLQNDLLHFTQDDVVCCRLCR